MSQYAPNGPALLAAAWGWENHTETEVGLSVHLPAPDGYGLHLVASNATFARRIYTMGELHRAFLDKRVLHSVLSAMYVCPYAVVRPVQAWASLCRRLCVIDGPGPRSAISRSLHSQQRGGPRRPRGVL